MKKIPLKEIAFPLDVEVIKEILLRNGIIKVGELPSAEGFFLLDENGGLIPTRQILFMVWHQYLQRKIDEYVKKSNADGVLVDLQKKHLILYYLPEDKEHIEETKKYQTPSPNTSYIA